MIKKDKQFRKFQMYGFLKNLRFFEPFLILGFLSSGLDYLQIGILYSIKSIATNILEIPTGVFADLYGRKKSMIFSMISYIISFSIFYFCNSFYLFMLAMIFFSFGEAFRTGTHKAMIFQYLKLNNMESLKVQYYGATRSASQLGSALNSLLSALIVFFSGNYKLIFLMAIIPYVLNLINLSTYPDELDGNIKKTKKDTLKDFLGAISNWKTFKLLLNATSYSSVFKSIKDYLQPIIESFALAIPVFLGLNSKKRTAILVGIIYFVLYLLTSIASRNSWKFKKKLNLTLFFGAIVIMLIGITYYFNFYYISIILFVFVYLIENIRRPIVVSYISEKSEALASVLSVESQITTLLTAFFSFLMGLVSKKYGIGMGIFVIGLILFVFSQIFWLKEKDLLIKEKVSILKK
ncbi:MFS transporter [Thermosipho melanesiensis]|uniref:Major facilitator superfamily MFS_1 n=2 Tax=Thermosipho melanesiensis TaxID=46541 RepID=A6LJ70_THEM4|nr:MFS transporter [Thermosipho melanesiensis]ABR29971.1 major facilitator superfamily MFS_1 [Thermosipho melanesiensis BI429]APT73175.1 MFS transporter [Thermosipho melanesiensis]